MAEPRWKDIARRKQEQRNNLIPTEWRIPSRYIPGEHFTGGVLTVPQECDILSSQDLDITETDNAKALSAAITRKKFTAVEVTTAFCKRAAIAQQVTNCLTEILFESSLKRATYLDAYLEKHGKPLGPFHGLPMTVKDSFNIEGVDSSIGLAALCFKPARGNAPLVDLLLSLGAVIIAKTNIPQTLASLDSVQ